ncbi:MAG: hypothetical protein HQK89_02975 [Nitrospirae bacterium]|nr:hypothetical protein [Nitrospirota bacterium]
MIKIDVALLIFIIQFALMSTGGAIYLLFKLTKVKAAAKKAQKELALKRKAIEHFIGEEIGILKQRLERFGDPEDNVAVKVAKDIESLKLLFMQSALNGLKSNISDANWFKDNIYRIFDETLRNVTDKIKNTSETGKTEVVNDEMDMQEMLVQSEMSFDSDEDLNNLRQKVKSLESEKSRAAGKYSALLSLHEEQKDIFDKTILKLKMKIAEFSAYKDLFDDLLEKLEQVQELNNKLKNALKLKDIKPADVENIIKRVELNNLEIGKAMSVLTKGKESIGRMADIDFLLEKIAVHKEAGKLKTAEDKTLRPELNEEVIDFSSDIEEIPATGRKSAYPGDNEAILEREAKIEKLRTALKKLARERTETINYYNHLIEASEQEKSALNNTVMSLKKRLYDYTTYKDLIEDTMTKLDNTQKANDRLRKVLESKDSKTEEIQQAAEDLKKNNKYLDACIEVIKKENKRLKDIIKSYEAEDKEMQKDAQKDIQKDVRLDIRKDIFSPNEKSDTIAEIMIETESLAAKNAGLKDELKRTRLLYEKVQGDYMKLQKEYLTIYKELKKHDISLKIKGKM